MLELLLLIILQNSNSNILQNSEEINLAIQIADHSLFETIET